MADKDASGSPEERARRASRRTRQNLAVATITLVVPIAVALALLAESEAGLVRIAFFNLHLAEPRGALAVGFGFGCALAATVALTRFVSQRRASASLLCLPPAFLAATTLAASIAWMPDPLAKMPDLAFGDRARAAASALMLRASLFDAGLLVASISLGVAALSLRPARATASINKDKRPLVALVVATLSLLSAALVARLLGKDDLGRDAVGSWVAALPAGMGLVAVVLGASRTNRGDGYAATRLLASACAGIGGVLLAALAPAMGEIIAISTPGAPLADLGRAARGLRRTTVELAAAGALFAVPIVLTTLVAMPPRGLSGALSRARPALLVTFLLALAPALFVLPTNAGLRHIESLVADQTRLSANPGVTLADPSLPAGALVVDLVSPFPTELPPTTAASVVLSWQFAPARREDGLSVRFDGLDESTYDLVLHGPYLSAPLRVSLPDPRVGARILMPALPLAPPLLELAEPLHVDPETAALSPRIGYLEIDATSSDTFVLQWRIADIAKVQRRVPREDAIAGGLRYPTLTAAAHEMWTAHGGHRDPQDRKRDRVMIRLSRGTSLEKARAVVAAVLSLERTRKTPHGEERSIPVFEVTVAEPLVPREPMQLPSPAAPEDPGTETETETTEAPEVLTFFGKLAREDADARLAVLRASVEDCYRDHVEVHGPERLEPVVRFVVGADGFIGQVNVNEPRHGLTANDEERIAPFTRCVHHATHRLTFPEPEDGSYGGIVVKFSLGPLPTASGFPAGPP
ncbi:hypothetical protein [Polyangium jinanense]|uniref:Uncharacterized protein n=1 Tax=Polyangium jinanense TaxID=2829994 RepID=A0A9X4AXX4_9BACT|nr:hypothetical protein [Polyangium jinanense]MDC3960147.1 hypothetical protein [Polyangium jinanense]MDC3986587.1 hypothetical protein [Polyangium jinanense]